jgi:peptidoglycan/xylan/chitin deacetylase (PgdA/CDA1 family)
MSRRATAASVASRLGFLPILERARSRPLLVVLVFHRVLRHEDCKYDPNVIEATPEEFDRHMAMLRKHHAVVDPSEMRELIAEPSKVRHLRVAITFDDGYVDNYAVAFPILKSHGLRATFFVPTHFVGTRHLSWWDQIAYVIRNSTRAELALRYPRPMVVRIDPRSPDSAIRTVLHALTDDVKVDRDRLIAELEEGCGVAVPREADERQFLSWAEVEEMERAGMAIGSHTHSHRILAGLSASEQKEECQRSHDLLRAKNCSFADALAYPVGHHDSFSPATVQTAKDAGYRFAFSNFGGVNAPDRMEPFNVRRFGMDLAEDAAQLRLRLGWANLTGKEIW